MIEMKLGKNNATYEESIAQLEEMKKKNEESYILPKSAIGWTKKTEDNMDTYYLNSNDSNLSIFFIHGGACVSQASEQHWLFMQKVSKQLNAEIIAPIYPLAPYHTYEEVYEKLINLYASWKQTHPDRKAVFMGDSAGGGIVLGLALRLRDIDIQNASQIVLISPWVDFTMTNPDISYYEKKDGMLSVGSLKAAATIWAGETDTADPRISAINANLSGLPDMLIIQGTAELFYPDVMLFWEKAKHAGISVKMIVGENLPHVYPILSIPESKKAINEICSFIG